MNYTNKQTNKNQCQSQEDQYIQSKNRFFFFLLFRKVVWWLRDLSHTECRPCSKNLLPTIVPYPFQSYARNLKGVIGCLFGPCVNAMGRLPHWRSRMEVSYCTCGFCAVIQRDQLKVSLQRILTRNNLNVCVILSPCEEGNYTCIMEMLGSWDTKKIQRYNNLPPYVTARWQLQQILPLNFLGHYTFPK